MSKFHLNTRELVQGEFAINKANIAFVFQVNCPGCFIYGFPIMNNMYELFKDKVGFIGVATAFEDFEYNNEDSLQLLLKDGTIVGETKKYYNANFGLSKYLDIPKFPIAFDCIASSVDFVNSDKIELICTAIPNFADFSATEREILILKLKDYYVDSSFIAETFTINQLKGTPSFIIFDDKYEIIAQYFGYQNEDVLKTVLENSLL